MHAEMMADTEAEQENMDQYGPEQGEEQPEQGGEFPEAPPEQV